MNKIRSISSDFPSDSSEPIDAASSVGSYSRRCSFPRSVYLKLNDGTKCICPFK